MRGKNAKRQVLHRLNPLCRRWSDILAWRKDGWYQEYKGNAETNPLMEGNNATSLETDTLL